jgi:hypothetical protein
MSPDSSWSPTQSIQPDRHPEQQGQQPEQRRTRTAPDGRLAHARGHPAQPASGNPVRETHATLPLALASPRRQPYSDRVSTTAGTARHRHGNDTATVQRHRQRRKAAADRQPPSRNALRTAPHSARHSTTTATPRHHRFPQRLRYRSATATATAAATATATAPLRGDHYGDRSAETAARVPRARVPNRTAFLLRKITT